MKIGIFRGDLEKKRQSYSLDCLIMTHVLFINTSFARRSTEGLTYNLMDIVTLDIDIYEQSFG